MKVLVLPVGSHGDVHPMVGIALGLKRRGHEVAVATNDHFRSLVERVGLEFISTGTDEEFRQTLSDPDLWHPVKGFRTVMEKGVLAVMKRTYELIVERYRPEESVIVGAGIAFGGRMAQDRWGYRVATVQLQPAAMRSVYENPKLPGMWMPRGMPRWMKSAMWGLGDWLVVDRLLKGPLNAFRGEIGLPALKGGILREWWNSPELVLGLWPGWFAPVQPDWPGQVRLVGFPMFDERGVEEMDIGLKRFLEEGERPIAFTPGSANVHGGRFFAESAEACARMGRRGILLTRHGEQIPRKLPAGVVHVNYAPFSELLPKCDALVHHGGIGTTAQALAAGVVQVIVPLAHDQFDQARRVKEMGVGGSVSTPGYRATKVARKLEQLLESEQVKENAKKVAARFAGKDGVGEACQLIEGLGGEKD